MKELVPRKQGYKGKASCIWSRFLGIKTTTDIVARGHPSHEGRKSRNGFNFNTLHSDTKNCLLLKKKFGNYFSYIATPNRVEQGTNKDYPPILTGYSLLQEKKQLEDNTDFISKCPCLFPVLPCLALQCTLNQCYFLCAISVSCTSKNLNHNLKLNYLNTN